MPPSQQWFLSKHEDGSIFGPLSFEQLAGWASSAQIASHDALSTNLETWIKAPMLPELGMDLADRGDDGTLLRPNDSRRHSRVPPSRRNQQRDLHHQFLRRDARKQISEMHGLLVNSGPVEEAKPAPAATRMSIGLQDRIRDLEQSLREERRALAEAEQRCAELERKC